MFKEFITSRGGRNINNVRADLHKIPVKRSIMDKFKKSRDCKIFNLQVFY